MIYLSYILDGNTPSYGNRVKFNITKRNAISNGDIANDSYMSCSVHIGTHIDMPYHFHNHGQTIKDYEPQFWRFKKPLIIEIIQDEVIIHKTLLEKLNEIEDIGYDIIIVKTGICNYREQNIFWEKNYGFHPDIYDALVKDFPSVRVFGFDSISVSSFSNRTLGREAHQKFLNPKNPILLLEDMDLRNINKGIPLKEIIVSPLRISNCDGLPCTVFGILDD